jgi:hypothetical protein
MFDFNRLLNALSSRNRANADFQRMLDWKLLRGSHEFPGPDGGTCINEAAIVAAGYPYRAIYRVRDLPGSFSRPIAMLALCLNDTLDDESRQSLLVPFVTRLAGSADTPKVEGKRAELVLERAVSEILAPALERAGYSDIAERCRSVRTPTELVAIARTLRNSDSSAPHRPLTSALEHAADAGRQWLSGLPTEVVFCAFSAIREVAALEGGRCAEQTYRRTVAILDAALGIGNQAQDGGPAMVARRMDAAKRAPHTTQRRETLSA